MIKKSFIYFLIIVFFTFGGTTKTIFAQSAVAITENAARKAELQAQLNQIEADIAAQQKILDDQKNRSDSLAKEIAILDATIKKYKLDIKAREIAIKELTENIGDKQTTIDKLSDKMQRERDSLAEIIRRTSEIDSISIIGALLSKESISGVFEDLDLFDSIKAEMQKSFTEITDTKEKTANEKADLESKRDDEMELKALQELQQKRIQEQEKQKSDILKASKGLEAGYQKVIKDKVLTAGEIRNQLFSLQGSAQISFPKAVEYATFVGAKTNIRPAFILGIIAEESNLGQNVGTGNWLVDMKAPRDTEPFLAICRNLGIDPNKAPVSKKAWYGYGGAMGPAQFIPSTWVLYGGFKKDGNGNWHYDAGLDKIRKALGTARPSDPWNPLDAFMASAILSKENGAKNGDFASERLAALRYLAGWTNATKKAYAFYGDDVMNLAAKYQAQIDVLNGK
ncbi:MAG: hypothetical protein WC631_00220 [Candidatus Paceibacterota bacterium]|jgi:peptidoglycan hydrolase CwlO-like protein